MYRWDFVYEPCFSPFTRLIETVYANNYEMAKMKFYGRVGDNVHEVLQVEKS